jgi:hypothetical protein
VLGILCVCATTANCAERQPDTNYIHIDNIPAFEKTGETFQVDVSLDPPSQTRQRITMDQTLGAVFSQPVFVLGPGERKTIRGTVKKSVSGLVWLHVSAPGYHDNWSPIVVDFEGSLKLSEVPTLPYGSPTTLTVSVSDNAGKPLRVPASLELNLNSADGLLRLGNGGWKNSLILGLDPGSYTSPQFQIKPTSIQGGSVHIAGALLFPESPQVLAQEDFSLNADPAPWLPIVLALMGGLLLGLYKSVRLFEASPRRTALTKSSIVLVLSALSGFVGYLFAHLDLLGLKLDPNVLRSYPLLGFLFSYFAFDVLIPRSLQRSEETSKPASAQVNARKRDSHDHEPKTGNLGSLDPKDVDTLDGILPSQLLQQLTSSEGPASSSKGPF